MMEYKGYLGAVTFDAEAGLFHGEVLNTRDVITFQGDSVAELSRAFRESVDDYLAFCESRNESPDRPYSGQFMARIPTDLHRRIDLAARKTNKSLNSWVVEALRAAVEPASEPKTRRAAGARRG